MSADAQNAARTPDSKKLAPAWDQLGDAYAKDTRVTIGKMDCTVLKNECGAAEVRALAHQFRSHQAGPRVLPRSRAAAAQIRGYPTIKAFYNGRELATHQARPSRDGRWPRCRRRCVFAPARRRGSASWGLCAALSPRRSSPPASELPRRKDTRSLREADDSLHRLRACEHCYGYTLQRCRSYCVTRRAAAAAATSPPCRLRRRGVSDTSAHDSETAAQRARVDACRCIHAPVSLRTRARRAASAAARSACAAAGAQSASVA